MFWLFLGEVTDTFVEELEGCIASCCLTQVAQLFLLAWAYDRKLAHFGRRQGRHPFSYSHDAFR